MKTIGARELQALRESDQPVEVLDIRPRKDFLTGHIAGAHCLPSVEVSPESILLSRHLLQTEPLYLVSQGGALAQWQACDLERQGLDNLVVVTGGMRAWEHDHLPVQTSDDIED